jgi:tRNA pseudouridine32 synthase / 23S rRNA pseudouridine746 synthase
MRAPVPQNLDLGHVPGTGLHVLHEDAHILVLDKPSGLLAVPAKPPGPQDCLHARAVAAFPDALLIHRLDMETSGVTVFARSRLAQRHLNWQFERRQVRKTYVARVAGRVEGDVGRIDLPLIADWPNRPRQMVCHQRGRTAVTDWRVLTREPAATRLELHPLTGRSHQLRVHCRSLGHPILGDPFYADPAALVAAPRLQLHAAALAFRHPDGGAWVEFASPVPF